MNDGSLIGASRRRRAWRWPTRSARSRWTRSRQANSGHPGMPMGMAEIAVALWSRHLRHNPANPRWPNRDRFVLSNGHGSMLLYALLHLTGYDLPIEELKRFRQLHPKTPGHPGARPDARRRDHHRPARPGLRQRGRHGARREAAGRRVQPPRPRHGRSPHLRVHRRRLPDGRHLARGVLARRHAGARQADRALRRQRHLDRLDKVDGWFTDDTRQALRGLRLARDRPMSTATTSRRWTRAIAQAQSRAATGRR